MDAKEVLAKYKARVDDPLHNWWLLTPAVYRELLATLEAEVAAHETTKKMVREAVAAKRLYDESGESGPWEVAWDTLRLAEGG